MDEVLWRRIEGIGDRLAPTDVARLHRDDVELFVKMESANPSGSAKDRSAFWIVREAVRRGEITRGTTVVESSSGNFALALAKLCRSLGVPFVPVIDPTVNAPTERLLRESCTRVEKVDRPDDAGGYLGGRLARVAELRARIADSYWPDQYSNTDAVRGHYELTGGELVRALPRIDYLFVGVGTGGTIAGLSRRVKAANQDATVVAVDVEGSVIFGGPPRRRHIPGIGSGIRPALLDHALIDEVVVVSERDEVDGCHTLLRDHGLFAGGSTGCVYAAVGRYFESYRGPPPVVAFLCSDRGDPYRNTIYDPNWVATTFAQKRVRTS
jgi:N-(2-amino-2-carboxyethyl)-L-glutamate synthase